MKRRTMIVPAVLAVMSLAGSAWAGGSTCSCKSEGAAKQTAAGSHCTVGAQAKGQCTFGANTAVFSFAVPTAHCGACSDKIQATAMAQKGVQCAKVDLDSRTAYVAGDQKLNQKAIAKAIKEAGYACTFKAKGPKVRDELVKMMAAGSNASPAAAKKDKV